MCVYEIFSLCHFILRRALAELNQLLLSKALKDGGDTKKFTLAIRGL